MIWLESKGSTSFVRILLWRQNAELLLCSSPPSTTMWGGGSAVYGNANAYLIIVATEWTLSGCLPPPNTISLHKNGSASGGNAIAIRRTPNCCGNRMATAATYVEWISGLFR